MFAFLKNEVTSIKKDRKSRASASSPRPASLSLESLEGRLLLTASPFLTVSALAHAGFNLMSIYSSPVSQKHSDTYLGALGTWGSGSISQGQIPGAIIAPKNVPDLRNVRFTMTGDLHDGSYPLEIQTQGASLGGVASFTGVWGPGAGTVVHGTLSVDGNNTAISFSWVGDDPTRHHTFEGVISGKPGAYHIHGTVMVNGVKAGAGTCDGSQLTPRPFSSNAESATVSDSNSAADPLQVAAEENINGETADPVEIVAEQDMNDGAADPLQILAEQNVNDEAAAATDESGGGVAGADTASYDANFNLTSSFSWDQDGNNEFDGTMPVDLISLPIDGMMSVDVDPTVGPGNVSGSQVY